MATVADLQIDVAALAGKLEEIAVMVAILRASQSGGISELELDAVRAAIIALSVRADEILA